MCTLDSVWTLYVLSHVREMGSSHSLQHNDTARQVWDWALPRNVWPSVCRIPGANHVIADRESRVFHIERD